MLNGRAGGSVVLRLGEARGETCVKALLLFFPGSGVGPPK